MTNELSTMLYRINFRYILDHFLDQALWKKSWRIYEYDGCILEMRLSEISIEDNKLYLNINRLGSWGQYKFSLPLSKDHFNEEVFYKSLFSRMLEAIQMAEYWRIANTEVYHAAIGTENEVDNSNKKKAEEYLDSLNITDEMIRTAYIEKYVDENSVDLRSKVQKELRYMMDSPRYLMLAYQLDNVVPEQSKALIGIVRDKCLGEGIDHQISQINEALSLFNFEDMTSLDDALEHLKEKQQEEEDADE